MDTAGTSAQKLRVQIAHAEDKLKSLREQLAQAETQEQKESVKINANGSAWKWPLGADEYDRYGRQLILPSVGIQGQICLFLSSQ